MKHVASLVLGLAIAASVFAQDGAWKDQHGNPAPQTEARRSLNGLGGSLLVTTDKDWREKWNTPAHTAPHFNEAKSITKGQQVFVLTFFAGARLDLDGNANLACDIDVMKPDGTPAIHQTDVVCAKGKILGGPYNTHLAAPVIGFSADVSDPTGTWTVRVALKDKLRDTVLPLKTSFTLE